MKQLTTKIHAITGGPNVGQITFAFAGSEEANGVYKLTGEVDEYGMRVFDGKEGRTVEYDDPNGNWALWVGDEPLYFQPLDPRSPAPTAQGWQCASYGLPPAPPTTFSWQREVAMCGHRGGIGGGI